MGPSYGLSFAYEDEYVFWEALVLGRKALLSGAAVFLAHSGTTIQVVVAILILFICYALQIRYRPLEHDWHDWMEEHSLMASTLVLIICLIANGGVSSELYPVATFLVSSRGLRHHHTLFLDVCEADDDWSARER